MTTVLLLLTFRMLLFKDEKPIQNTQKAKVKDSTTEITEKSKPKKVDKK